MERIAQFQKVTLKQYLQDSREYFQCCTDSEIKDIYNDIKRPKRATSGSAGYDFYIPDDVIIEPGDTIKVPTGIRVKIQDGWVLQVYPRSSLGFKYKLQLDNTVGIIDSDYYYAKNEGHIFVKATNNSNKAFVLYKGDAFMQGIFMQYGITVEDNVTDIRSGGIGSTNR
jgi:dUTP pyrophosphatase